MAFYIDSKYLEMDSLANIETVNCKCDNLKIFFKINASTYKTGRYEIQFSLTL